MANVTWLRLQGVVEYVIKNACQCESSGAWRLNPLSNLWVCIKCGKPSALNELAFPHCIMCDDQFPVEFFDPYNVGYEMCPECSE